MLRLDATNWHEYEVELIDRRQHASVVATREYSDWSMVARPSNSPLLALHDARRASDIEVHYAVDGESFILTRPTYLPDGPAFVGPMLAAPDGDDVTATFAAWSFSLSDDGTSSAPRSYRSTAPVAEDREGIHIFGRT